MDREDLLEEVIVYSSAPTNNMNQSNESNESNKSNDSDKSND